MWINKQLYSIDEITKFLNTLGDAANTAKVVCSSSSMSNGGWYYYVWYKL